MSKPDRVVLTMGTFDILHSGHIFLFEQCRKIAGPNGEVVVTANSDEFVKMYKGQYPAQNIDDRLAVLQSIKHIDYVETLTSQEDTESMINYVFDYPTADRFMVIGSDWAPPKDYPKQLGVDEGFFVRNGISLLYIPRTDEHSSTNIKNRVRNSV